VRAGPIGRPHRGRGLLSLLAVALTGLVGLSCSGEIRSVQVLRAPATQTTSAFPLSPSSASSRSSRSPAAGSSGSTGPAPRPLRVTAIGDSVTAGSNCRCPAFPALYAAALARTYGTPVAVINDGQGGETSQDVDDDLSRDPTERAEIADSDIVVVTIGANDFGDRYTDITNARCGDTDELGCVRDELTNLRADLQSIVTKIRRLRGDRNTAILLTGYWNVFQDGAVARNSLPSAGLEVSDALTLVTNATMVGVAEELQVTYVDLYQAFKGSDGQADPTVLLALDGDHPNAAGHRLIARTLLDAGVAPLAPGQR